jgi:hypothetical protein
MLFVPNMGLLLHAELLRAAWNAGTPLYAHLYQNNYTPVPGSVLSNFTPATYDGYAPQPIISWASAVLIGNVGNLLPAPLIWQHTAGVVANTIYGWYGTDATGMQLWMAELFGTPQNMLVDGDAFALQIAWTDTHS